MLFPLKFKAPTKLALETRLSMPSLKGFNYTTRSMWYIFHHKPRVVNFH